VRKSCKPPDGSTKREVIFMMSKRTLWTAVLSLGWVPALAVADRHEQGERQEGAGLKRDEPAMEKGKEREGREGARERKEKISPEVAGILGKLHHVNQMEIQTGRLAHKRGANKEVREYGKQLAAEHQKADRQVKQLARQLGVKLEKPRDREMRQRIEDMQKSARELRQLRGAEFDKKFLATQAETHKDVIETLKQQRDKVEHKRVEQLIDQMIPELEQHRDRAKKLLAKVEGEKEG
jgi:putative membrane protein